MGISIEALCAPTMMELRRIFGRRLLRDEPLARHCSLGVGGPADVFILVHTRDELRQIVSLAGRAGIPLRVLGSGANVLPSDAGFRGIVVRNVATRAEFALSQMQVTADSGASLPVLARRLARAGLGGLEWGTGIPGTVGGATVNNAGAHGGAIADALVRVETVDSTGRHRFRERDELAYAYRRSALKSWPGRPPLIREVVLASSFHVRAAGAGSLLEKIAHWAAERSARQPLKLPSAGSFFQNPPGDHAGRLIEAAGLKGLRLGGAEVSTLHANFLLNRNGATAREVYELGSRVRAHVQERMGVTLEMEVEMIGDWDSIVSPPS
jgi:UDP-N-acetylmuramate dehydrogenase